MAAPRADDVVEDLVHQFTDPFAFYRELIQNSIDAGSSRIEVALSFRPGRDAGLLSAAVTDWGEGMSRDVIENYLVTKFRSAKENDLTKIGKFGIGFVSVFACQPDAVVVDTGRDGQSWRVLFKQDRAWELLAATEPFEGTRVTLHKRPPPAEYDDFVHALAGVGEEVVPLLRGGRDLRRRERRRPPAARADAGARGRWRSTRPSRSSTAKKARTWSPGPRASSRPWTGFYNRGLTLLETQEPLVPRVTARVVSRFLEHTLTRDNVRRDRHFDRVRALAKTLVDGKLRAALPEESRRCAQRPDGADDWQVLFRYACAAADPSKLFYRLAGGGAVPFKDVARAVAKEKALVVSPGATPVSARLVAAGTPVLEAAPGEALAHGLTQAFGAKTARLADHGYVFAEPPATGAPTIFLEALHEALTVGGVTTRGVLVGELHGALDGARWARVDAPGVPVRADLAAASAFAKGAPALLCLNAKHPEVAAALPLFHSAPRLASLLLTRCVLVAGERLTASVDLALTQRALR